MILALSRRRLLAGAALLTLAACANAVQVVDTVAQDAAAIAGGLKGVLPQVGTIVGVPAATVAKVGQYVADIQSAAGAVQAAAGSAPGQATAVQQIATAVNGIVGALAAFSAVLPSPVSAALAAASVLLPVIESAVGLVIPKTAAIALPPPVAAQAATMTPDKALATLQQLAGGG